MPQVQASSLTTNHSTYPESATKMYVLKRAHCTDGLQMGDIIPLSHIHAPVDLVPQYMHAADI